MESFNNQTISVFPNNDTSMNGIFALLKEMNGDYGSRYNVSSSPNSSFLDKYKSFPETKLFRSNDNECDITFSFDSPFLLYSYSIVNAVVINDKNSYPEDWELYGKDEFDKSHLIERRTNQMFCSSNLCTEMRVKSFKVKTQRKPYSTYVWRQTKNSCSKAYIFVKAFEFFGTLCGLNGCRYHGMIHSCFVKRTNKLPLIFLFIFIALTK